MNSVRIVTLHALLLLAPALAQADGYFSFTNIPIAGDRVVLGTTYYSPDVNFTALPYGNGAPGELGLVRSNVLWYCIYPLVSHTMLGTSDESSGSIGEGLFPIRLDLATPLVPPAVVHVQVQTRWENDVNITLYDANGNIVGTQGAAAANLVTGHCGPGDPIYPMYKNGIFSAVALGAPVVSAMVQVAAPFTIESVSWNTVVAVEPTTWGRVKALYRSNERR